MCMCGIACSTSEWCTYGYGFSFSCLFEVVSSYVESAMPKIRILYSSVIFGSFVHSSFLLKPLITPRHLWVLFMTFVELNIKFLSNSRPTPPPPPFSPCNPVLPRCRKAITISNKDPEPRLRECLMKTSLYIHLPGRLLCRID